MLRQETNTESYLCADIWCWNHLQKGFVYVEFSDARKRVLFANFAVIWTDPTQYGKRPPCFQTNTGPVRLITSSKKKVHLLCDFCWLFFQREAMSRTSHLMSARDPESTIRGLGAVLNTHPLRPCLFMLCFHFQFSCFIFHFVPYVRSSGPWGFRPFSGGFELSELNANVCRNKTVVAKVQEIVVVSFPRVSTHSQHSRFLGKQCTRNMHHSLTSKSRTRPQKVTDTTSSQTRLIRFVSSVSNELCRPADWLINQICVVYPR